MFINDASFKGFKEAPVLTPDHLGDFVEVGNIGAGRACARLSQMTQRRCLINVPTIEFLNSKDIISRLQPKDSKMAVLFTKMGGEIPSWMFLFVDEAYCRVLAHYITRNAEELNGLRQSSVFALKQMGDHVAWAHAKALQQFLKAVTMHAMPELVCDSVPRVEAILREKIGADEDRHMVIHAQFFDPEKTFLGRYFFVLKKEAQWMMLKKLQQLWEMN